MAIVEKSEAIPMSPFWSRLVTLVALVKASVAGATAGLALLGAFDIAFATTAVEWWDSLRPDTLLNAFAISGGAVGLVWRTARIFI